MDLRKFQEDALESLRLYLDALHEQNESLALYNEFLETQGKPPDNRDIPDLAWKAMEEKKQVFVKEHKTRLDGAGRSIPNICFKIPTGGGKTLLAAHSASLINQHYFRRRTGLVLWVVPSESIYRQTMRSFRDGEHPYRMVLDRAAPRRRVRIVDRRKGFAPRDVYDDLTVMLLMLQASNRETKAQLRMFRAAGNYMGFFPATDDFLKSREMLGEIPNLDVTWLNREPDRESNRPFFINSSLGNTLRVLRPIIVLDEGHKAYSEQAMDTINDFNPRFILELSATPDAERSNILVNVPGRRLKDEQMIKLPVQLRNIPKSDWQTTLAGACERLGDLDKQAQKHRAQTGNYIRPMLLVRVERTGADQRKPGIVHAEDAREYLTQEMGFRQDEVRVKSSDANEIADADLMSESCQVRAIITKSALQEGWDCPFAYVLAILDKGRASRALTQMIGRVLRQPYAKTTGVADLDMAHVFCFDQNVNEAAEKIQAGLQKEGLSGIPGSVRSGEGKHMEPFDVSRRELFRDLNILLPRVLHRDGKGDEPRELDYERDILSAVNWSKMRHTHKDLWVERDSLITRALVDDEDVVKDARREQMEGEATPAFFARHLSDVVPNPWQAMRIVKEAWPELRKTRPEKDFYNDRMNVVCAMREDIIAGKNRESEKVFRKKLEDENIIFNLDATQCRWRIPDKMRIIPSGRLRYLTRETGEQIALSLFEKYDERDFNDFEQKIAGYIDQSRALDWWHRVAARHEYGLQGWRKHRVYPDFVLFFSRKKKQILYLETKGEHLEGNPDTRYKEELFAALENGTDIGSATLSSGEKEIALRIILQSNWQETLTPLLKE